MTDREAVEAIGVLTDPIRMRLFRYIAERRDAVSREEAAEALAIPLTKVKFHLERLAEEGLLDTEYRRMTGKRGPGAGRPAKLYRRSSTEFRVSLPERRYDIMGSILAGAVAKTRAGEALDSAIDSSAYENGQESVPEDRAKRHDTAPIEHASSVLTALGYDAEVAADPPASEVLRLHNCPFDALANEHRALVCGANVNYVQGVLDGSECGDLTATLEPCPGHCCVAVRKEPDARPSDGSATGEDVPAAQ